MKLSKRIMALIIASILSIGLVGCSKNKENEISDALPQEEPVEEIIDGEVYTDDSERALAEYEGNMNPIEDESAEDVVINNGLKELSREEVVESFRSNTVKIVLEGKVEDYRNFEPTIRKEAEYFIKNYEKYPRFEDEYPNEGGGDTYRVKYRRIEISAEDMEMYAIFRYGESAEGKWITFDAMDNDVSMKKTQETIESDKLELLLSDLEKSLNEEYGGMM